MTDVYARAERVMGMSERAWLSRASPWNGWAGFATVLPLVIAAVWSRVWIGWWSRKLVAALTVRLWTNLRAVLPLRRLGCPLGLQLAEERCKIHQNPSAQETPNLVRILPLLNQGSSNDSEVSYMDIDQDTQIQARQQALREIGEQTIYQEKWVVGAKFVLLTAIVLSSHGTVIYGDDYLNRVSLWPEVLFFGITFAVGFFWHQSKIRDFHRLEEIFGKSILARKNHDQRRIL